MSHSVYAYLCTRSDEELREVLKMQDLPDSVEKPPASVYALTERILQMRQKAAESEDGVSVPQ